MTSQTLKCKFGVAKQAVYKTLIACHCKNNCQKHGAKIGRNKSIFERLTSPQNDQESTSMTEIKKD